MTQRDTRGVFKGAHKRAKVLALMLLAASISCVNVVEAFGQAQPAQAVENLRHQAVSALEEILGEATAYKDASARIRVRTRIADSLWTVDKNRSKGLLLEAYNEISILKSELNERYRLRSEVIGVARRHDPEFASKMIADSAQADEKSLELLKRDSVERISERGALYLDSARELLENGDQNRALSFARRSFPEGRSSQFIWFLNELRNRDRAAADKLFLEALIALRREGADPNDILYFGLYIFRPGEVVVGNLSSGVEAISYGISFNATPSPPLNLVRPYLQAAAEALMAFQVIPGQPGSTEAMEIKRFALGQLLPLYERYYPEHVATMQAELVRLSQALPVTPGAKEAPGADHPDPTSVEEAIEQIERLPTSKERDHYFFNAAIFALDKGNIKGARVYAARIDEDKLKRSTAQLIEFKAAQAAIKLGELDEAIKLADAGLTRGQRAIIYYQASSGWLAKGNQARASELISAAINDAGKAEEPAIRAGVFIYLAAGLAEREPLRAFEIIETALKDINAVEDFNLIDERVGFEMETGLGASYKFTITEDDNLSRAMSYLALADPARALGFGRSLRAPERRAYAVITVCQSVLRVAKKPVKKS